MFCIGNFLDSNWTGEEDFPFPGTLTPTTQLSNDIGDFIGSLGRLELFCLIAEELIGVFPHNFLFSTNVKIFKTPKSNE